MKDIMIDIIIYDINEALIRTTYQTLVFDDIIFSKKPLSFGSGFFIIYKNISFFVTADHNISIDDYEKNIRTGNRYYLAIPNNILNMENFTSLLTHIDNFYHMSSLKIKDNKIKHELIDVAISMIDDKINMKPFFTLESNQPKIVFTEELIVKPNKTDKYYIYGYIKQKFNGLRSMYMPTLKNELLFIEYTKDYLLLNYTENIILEDWEGLSGSPVLNQNGKCLGMLCSVIENTKSVFVVPFTEITRLFDIIISQKK